MLSFLLSASQWTISGFSGLPDPTQVPDPQLRDYALVAGGLALLLSRCSPRAARREFKATSDAYRSLKRQARRRQPVALPAQLLSDVSHEVAPYVDVATRDALRRCLQRTAVAARRN
jgi:hypothetical protein